MTLCNKMDDSLEMGPHPPMCGGVVCFLNQIQFTEKKSNEIMFFISHLSCKSCVFSPQVHLVCRWFKCLGIRTLNLTFHRFKLQHDVTSMHFYLLASYLSGAYSELLLLVCSAQVFCSDLSCLTVFPWWRTHALPNATQIKCVVTPLCDLVGFQKKARCIMMHSLLWIKWS